MRIFIASERRGLRPRTPVCLWQVGAESRVVTPTYQARSQDFIMGRLILGAEISAAGGKGVWGLRDFYDFSTKITHF